LQWRVNISFTHIMSCQTFFFWKIVCHTYTLLVLSNTLYKFLYQKSHKRKQFLLFRPNLKSLYYPVACGIITPTSHFCVFDCRGVESAQHLFLSCSTFDSLWTSIRSLIGFSAVDSHDLLDHFLRFTYRWSSTTVVLSATHLAHMCLGCM
jgi:hypothetical protein